MYQIVKRICDLIFAVIGMIITSPLWIIAIIGILISDWGPIFYTAHRIGKGNKPFKMYKFRSMRVARVANEASLRPDEDRIFTFGHFIRKVKIDELPQILNLFNGTMSLIGPRPVAQDQYDLFRTGKWNLAANYNNVVIPMPWDAVRQPDAKYVRSDFKVIESNVFAKCSTIKRSEIDRYLGITPAPAADYPGPWGRTSGGISTDHLAPVYLNRYYSVQDIPDVIDRKGDWTYTKEDFLKERKRQDSLQNVYVKRLVTLINEGDADIVFPLISE